jgi:hypothetical protein
MIPKGCCLRSHSSVPCARGGRDGEGTHDATSIAYFRPMTIVPSTLEGHRQPSMEAARVLQYSDVVTSY